MTEVRTRAARARSLLLAAILAILTWPSHAAAQTIEPAGQHQKVRITYAAPRDCPTESAFLEAVRARVRAAWEAAPGDLAHRIEVTVQKQDASYAASIRFSSSDGTTVVRSVSGSACADVVSGIALVTALAIDSRVEEAILASEPARRAAAPPSVTPQAANPPARAAPKPPKPAQQPENPVHFRLGAMGFALTGVGPELAFGPGGFVGAEWSTARFGLAFAALNSGRVVSEGVPAEFGLWFVRLDACPIALEPVHFLAFEPCLLAELGSLRGKAFEAPPRVSLGGSGGSLWVAAGALARVVVRTGPLWVGLEAIARVPLLHERFFVLNGAEPDYVFESPAVSFGAALGVGVRF